MEYPVWGHSASRDALFRAGLWSKSILTPFLPFQDCLPRVTPGASVASYLSNPSATEVTFWSNSASAQVSFSTSVPQSAPMQLQVLMDMNGQSLAEANQLADVLLEGSLDNVFGASLGAGSNISVRFYTEAPTSGALLSIGGGSVFNSDWSNVADSIGVSYLLSNKEKPSTTPSSTRLLELAAEILNGWPSAQSTPNALQVLVIVTPNNVVTTGEQWSTFEAAVRSSMVLPVFFSPSSASAPWKSDLTSLWASAFPSYPTAPIALGSLSIDEIWQDFNIKAALDTAVSFVIGGGATTSPASSGPSTSSTPVASTPAATTSSYLGLSPLIISSTSSTDLSFLNDELVAATSQSASLRKVSFSLALNASVNPLSAPSTYTAGILGTRPVTFTSAMESAPSGTNAVIPIQTSKAFTPLSIPVSNDTLSITIISLPTQGVLASNGVNITAVPFSGATTSFSYIPNTIRGEDDSFLYSLQLACGSWNGFSMVLNLTYVPMTPIVTSTPTITLTEDDMTAHAVNFGSLVSRTYPSSTIVLLSLANMAGNLTQVSTGSAASLTTLYPVGAASFDFSNYSPSRGARSFNITYLVDNGQGETATGVVFFSITDLLHVPQAFSQTADAKDQNWILLNDADGDNINVAITFSSMNVCWWNMETKAKTCANAASSPVSWTLPTPALISAQYAGLLNLATGSISMTLSDNTQATTNTYSGTLSSSTGILGAVVSLVSLVLNLVTGLLSALVGISADTDATVRINFNSGVPNTSTASNCYFPVAPGAAKMRWMTGDTVTAGYSIAWGSDASAHYADYTVYRGVSGPDSFFFQCAYPAGSGPLAGSGTGAFFIYQLNVPLPKPSASSLSLSRAANAASIFIPIQGLVSAGGLAIKNIVADAGSTWNVVSGGILFYPINTASTLSYTLCSLLNSTLCTGVIENAINTVTSLPVLATSTQSFKANLKGAVNTFKLNLPSGVDGIIVQSLGLIRSGTVTINGVTLSSSTILQYIPSDGTFTFEVVGSLPITADLLTIYSFTFVAVSNGYPSQPGTVYILPISSDLTSILPTVTNALSTLVADLNDTLAIVSTLVPGFRVELDIFGKKSSQSLYEQLEESVAAANDLSSRRAMRAYIEETYGSDVVDRRFALTSSHYAESQALALATRSTRESLSTESVAFTATMTAPPAGKLELCDANGTCVVIAPGASFTITYADSVFLTPPLLTDLVQALGTLTWDIVVLVDNVLLTTIEGTVQLANDVISDTLRSNVLSNVASALTRSVPGVRNLLQAAGLDPNGCGGVVPPSPFVCYQGQLIANDTVTVNQTLFVNVAETRVLNGNLNVTTTGSLVLQFVEFGTADLSNLPFFNVSGDVNADGPIFINVTEQQLERLVFTHTTRDAYFEQYYESKRRSAQQGPITTEPSPNASPDSVNAPVDAPVDAPITTDSPLAAPTPNAAIESKAKPVIEATTISTLTPPMTLVTITKCYSMKTTKSTSGTRQTLMTIFVFNPEQDSGCVPPPPSEYAVDPSGNPVPYVYNLDPANPASPAHKRRSYYIMVGSLIGVTVFIILLVIAVFLIFKYNRSAKRVARPYRVRKAKGQTYRTQPSHTGNGVNGTGGSTESSSYGSTEMLVHDPESPRTLAVATTGFSAEMEDPVSSSYEESEEMEHDSDNDSLPDETEDDGEMPRSLPPHPTSNAHVTY